MSKAFFQIGNFSGYLPELAKMSREDFFAQYKNVVKVNITTIWDIMQERIKDLDIDVSDSKENNTTGKTGKKFKSKKDNGVSVQKSGVQKTDN